MFEIKDHYIANEIVKFIKKYSINLKKIIKRLQLTIFKHKKKMNRRIQTTAVYILNDFKRVHSKIYSDFFASIQKNFRAVSLMIRNMKLIKNFQINVSFDDDFVKNFSVTASRADIIKIDTSTSSTRAVVFKFSISKIAFVISCKASQVERINQLNKSNVISSVASLISF